MSQGSLLILDDDNALRRTLSRAMEQRGFEVRSAEQVSEALLMIKEAPPEYAILDLKLEDRRQLPNHSHLRV